MPIAPWPTSPARAVPPPPSRVRRCRRRPPLLAVGALGLVVVLSACEAAPPGVLAGGATGALPAAAPAPAEHPLVATIRAAFTARGATEADVAAAVAVALCESGDRRSGNPATINPSAIGGANYGMFQLNRTAQERRALALGFTWDRILDPTVNATVAADLWVARGRMFSGSSGWSCARIMGVR